MGKEEGSLAVGRWLDPTVRRRDPNPNPMGSGRKRKTIARVRVTGSTAQFFIPPNSMLCCPILLDGLDQILGEGGRRLSWAVLGIRPDATV